MSGTDELLLGTCTELSFFATSPAKCIGTWTIIVIQFELNTTDDSVVWVAQNDSDWLSKSNSQNWL